MMPNPAPQFSFPKRVTCCKGTKGTNLPIKGAESPSVNRAFKKPAKAELGIAIIFVLAMLVMVLVLVLAYFSSAALNRQISSSSTSNLKAELLSEAATSFILDDIKHEIEIGSKDDPLSTLAVQVKQPITILEAGSSVPVAPSMTPQRVGVSGSLPANAIKISRNGVPFFTPGAGYRTAPDYAAIPNRSGTGLSRASAISTTDPATNGRFVPKDRWNKPKLMTDSELADSFSAPDWIYVDREGKNPTDFTQVKLATLSTSGSNNKDFVIGRYAYVVYDVGGLIDINVAGNALAATENNRRGRLNQVSLLDGGIGGVAMPNFQEFVTWRSSASGSNSSSTPGAGGLFDPKRTFVDVLSGDQAFVSRQDLLAYAARPASPIPPAALPYLTTFSRDLNAPSYEPDPNRPKTREGVADPLATELNVPLLSVRFQTDTLIARPGQTAFTVKAGTPLLFRRFPLSKLNLFEQENPDPAEMKYYFGLEKVGTHTWRYTQRYNDRIARLNEVAIDLKREPNFFEILQAVLYTGSLGKSTNDTYTKQQNLDSKQNLQVMQIGANIIDQWDSKDIPTTIQYPSGVTPVTGNPDIDYFTVYGIENLPYISQMGITGWRPTYDRDRFQAWALFDVWNPHQNAKTPPEGIDGFRIVPLNGLGKLELYYQLYAPSGPLQPLAAPLVLKTPAEGGTLVSYSQPITSLNAGREFSFSAIGDYSEPTTLGSEPSSSSDTPGVLLADLVPGIAIPPVADRGTALQTTISALETEIKNVYGVKAHNTFRFLKNTNWRFALQAHHTGEPPTQWHTYQVLEGFTTLLDKNHSPLSGDSSTTISINTHHSMPDASLNHEFYQWRSLGATNGLVKIDPRTNRFGLSGLTPQSSTMGANDFMGRSIRETADPLPATHLAETNGTTINNDPRWLVPGGKWIVGLLEDTEVLTANFDVMDAFKCPPQKNRVNMALFGTVTNSPDALDGTRPMRYADPDGVIRPGDGYFGSLPTVRTRVGDRPIILNRPFRSVGELGYVFRDNPWKTLDFFTRHSADLGLLDVFSISDTEEPIPLTAGQVNLNTRHPSVLAAIIQNSSKQLPNISSVTASEIPRSVAETIAQEIVNESSRRPFFHKGDLVTRVFNKESASDLLAGEELKTAREAAIRSLAEMGTTRTWNFMIDLISQTGRLTRTAKTGKDFLVQGEERVWIHVSIDRMTGKVLEIRKEVVNE